MAVFYEEREGHCCSGQLGVGLKVLIRCSTICCVRVSGLRILTCAAEDNVIVSFNSGAGWLVVLVLCVVFQSLDLNHGSDPIYQNFGGVILYSKPVLRMSSLVKVRWEGLFVKAVMGSVLVMSVDYLLRLHR